LFDNNVFIGLCQQPEGKTPPMPCNAEHHSRKEKDACERKAGSCSKASVARAENMSQ